MKIKQFIYPILCVILVGCKLKVRSGEEIVAHYSDSDIPSEIPASVETGGFAEKYLDAFRLADPFVTHDKVALYPFLEGYVAMMQELEDDQREKSQEVLLKRIHEATTTNYLNVVSVLEDICYDPNSPFYDEALLLKIFDQAIWRKDLPKEVEHRVVLLRKLLQQNNVGECANDFYFTNRVGKKARLHSIQEPYTLLFFADPACQECQAVKSRILSSKALLLSKKVHILSIYPDLTHLEELPQDTSGAYKWTNALWEEDPMTLLYDLKVIPTLYLLDKNKQVLLKDPTPEQLIRYMEQYFV